MRFIDLFGGIGGFRLGIQKATKGKWECVGYYDSDKYSVQTYNKNFKEKNEAKDIREIRSEAIQTHDLLCGGFPCQAFSIAGKRLGFNDTRGTLFYEIMRIARYHHTKYLFLENVKGLLSHDQGRTFATILSTLDECGYNAQWQVLNSKYFGVPQNRERVFIIANLRGTPRPKVFPFGVSSGEVNGVERKIEYVNNSSREMKRVYDPKGIAPCLHLKTGGWQEPKIATCLDANYHKGNSPSHVKNNRHIRTVVPVLTPDREKKRQNGRRFKEEGDPMFTLTGQDKHGVFDGYKIRRLTPLECERLQGFPDGWTAYGLCT